MIDETRKVGTALVLILVVLFVGSIVAGLIVDSAGVTQSFEPDTEEEYVINQDSEVPDGFEVKATTETALEFSDGAYVDSVSHNETFDDEWSVLAVASIESGYEEATMDVVAHDNETILLQYQAGEWAAEYRDGDETAQTSVDAEDPHNLTALSVVWDESELTVRADGDESEPATLTEDREPRSVSVGWHGTIDEVRTFGDVIAEDSIEQFEADPIDPLTDEQHHSRLMFDEGEGDETEVFYADTQASIQGAEWTDGVEDPGLDEDVDYAVSVSPLSVIALENGYLDGAPIAYYQWDGSGFAAWAVETMDLMGTIFTLLIIAVLAMAAMAIYREIGGGGFGAR